MKLAEALIERADLQKSLEIMRGRLKNNAKVQEGAVPNEDIDALLVEMDATLTRLEWLIVHINKTNERSIMSDGGDDCRSDCEKGYSCKGTVASFRFAVLRQRACQPIYKRRN